MFVATLWENLNCLQSTTLARFLKIHATVPAIADESSGVRRGVCISLSNTMVRVRMYSFLQRGLLDGALSRKNRPGFGGNLNTKCIPNLQIA